MVQRGTLRFVSSAAVIAALCACSSDAPPIAGPAPEVSIRLEVAPDGRAPGYGEAPWPSDALRSEIGALEPMTGLETVVPRNAALLASHVAALDGFGLFPTIELFVTGPLDPSSVPERTGALEDAAFLVDVDETSPERGRVVPMDWRYDEARLVLAGAVEYGTVLREGTRYAAIATAALRDAQGRPLVRAAGLDAVQDGADAEGAATPARWSTTAAALAWIEGELGVERERIVGATVFTTQHATAPLVHARRVLDDPAAAPAPELTFPDASVVFDTPEELDRLLGVATRDAEGVELLGWSNPTGIAHDHVGVVASGVMTSVRFTRDDSGTDDPADETFDIDPASGLPRVVETRVPVPVTFVLPAAPPPTEAGYPLVLFAHGLGASRHAVVTFAEPLTRAGFAIAAIDAVSHGSRNDPTDERNNLVEVTEELAGEADLRDGFGDRTGIGTTATFFENMRNFSAVRDAFRQTVLDLCQLVRLVRSPELDLGALAARYGGVAPRVDTSRLAYIGESFGAHIGAVLMAVEPDLELYVLDVPGGGLLAYEATSAPVLYSLVVPFAGAVYAVHGRFDRFNPLVAMTQAIFDGADPLVFAPHVLRDRLSPREEPNGPRHVVVIEVLGDELVPNRSTAALARALGAQVLTPWLDPMEGVEEVASPAQGNVDGQTAVVVQYSPATHGANWTTATGDLAYVPGFPHDGDEPFPRLPAPITIANPLVETLDQVVEILETHATTGIPVVRMRLPPRADFDGDGLLDDDERAMGRDPWDPAR